MKHFFIVFIPAFDILLLIVRGGGSIPQESLFGITYYEIQISTSRGSQNTSIQCGTKINTSIQCGTKLDLRQSSLKVINKSTILTKIQL